MKGIILCHAHCVELPCFVRSVMAVLCLGKAKLSSTLTQKRSSTLPGSNKDLQLVFGPCFQISVATIVFEIIDRGTLLNQVILTAQVDRVAEILEHRLCEESIVEIDSRISSALKKILVVMPNNSQEVLDQLKVCKERLLC